MTGLQLTIGVLTLFTNAFFVGAEFALISVRRSQIEPLAQRGENRAKTVLWGLKHLSAAMATAQLGITVSSLVLGAVAEPAIAHLLEAPFEALGVSGAMVHPIAFVIALTLATYLHMLIGEMVPKNIALAAPAATALALGPALVGLTRALRPVTFGINAFANSLLRLIKVEPKDEVASVFTDDDLVHLIKASSAAGLLEPSDIERLRDALALGTRPVGSIMVPLKKMVTVGERTTPRQLEHAASSAGYSRFPVTGPAGASGYLHIKDVLGVTERDEPFPPAALHPVPTVRIDTALDDALTLMRAAGSHMTAITGEKGTVLGFVTLDDVLGELIGPDRSDGTISAEA
ncbi:Hemolysin, contains CBS domains [Streptomyces sp. WMMB 714]|uniref:hemolysin family protein n=1 Tax=Streptomyces sp. WMMB 714 TaxID=1286822 RepID=UPI0005F79190|nr:hemolysin family protein [Streptomyces sp. WMMB 714]SCK09501.1 Hemolysin, contains CBS domains [Streptomyces sp. WMMB 714]